MIFRSLGAAIVVFAIVPLLQGGCDSRAPSQSTASATVRPDTSLSVAEPFAQGCLEAGAEVFEALTERAASASVDKLNSEVDAATTHALACRSYLSEAQASELRQIVERVGLFHANSDRTALALNAVEGYRVFVSAQARGAHQIPLEVALLDYAGFRYQAGVAAPTPRWDDARRAVDYADAQWRTVSARVSDAPLKASVAENLAAMRRAVETSDVASARRLVVIELDHVDALEQQFSRGPTK